MPNVTLPQSGKVKFWIQLYLNTKPVLLTFHVVYSHPQLCLVNSHPTSRFSLNRSLSQESLPVPLNQSVCCILHGTAHCTPWNVSPVKAGSTFIFICHWVSVPNTVPGMWLCVSKCLNSFMDWLWKWVWLNFQVAATVENPALRSCGGQRQRLAQWV